MTAGGTVRALAIVVALLTAASFNVWAAPDPAFPVPALPGLGPSSVRVAEDPDRGVWRGVGRVQTVLGARCTGFLVEPGTVVTAAHCLWLPKVGRFIQPGDVHVLFGVDLDRWRVHARAGGFFVPPGYDPRAEDRTARLDRAFLSLDAPAGAASDLLRLAGAMPPAGTRLMLGGYDQDREEKLLADPACHLLGSGDGLIRHDCAGTRGTSGAPLLAEVAPGTWRVIGVAIEANDAGPGGLAASLVPVSGPASAPASAPTSRGAR